MAVGRSSSHHVDGGDDVHGAHGWRFALYTNTIMPGLPLTDDSTFAARSRRWTRPSSYLPFIGGGFVGALVFTGLAAVLHLGDAERSVLPWTVAALVLYLAVFVITIAVNVPLNNGIKAAGSPDAIADLAGVRRRFDEARWARWNLVRAVATTAAFGCLAGPSVLYGRRS